MALSRQWSGKIYQISSFHYCIYSDLLILEIPRYFEIFLKYLISHDPYSGFYSVLSIHYQICEHTFFFFWIRHELVNLKPRTTIFKSHRPRITEQFSFWKWITLSQKFISISKNEIFEHLFHRVTSHRLAEVVRDLWKSSCTNPCSRRATYSQLPKAMFGELLNISNNEDSTASAGSLCQCSVPLRIKSFLIFKGSILCFGLCSLPLILPLSTDSIIFTYCTQIFTWVDEIPQDWTLQYRCASTSGEQKGAITFFKLLAVRASKPGIRGPCHKGTFLAQGPALSTPCPATHPSAYTGAWGLSLSWGRALHFPSQAWKCL